MSEFVCPIYAKKERERSKGVDKLENNKCINRGGQRRPKIASLSTSEGTSFFSSKLFTLRGE